MEPTVSFCGFSGETASVSWTPAVFILDNKYCHFILYVNQKIQRTLALPASSVVCKPKSCRTSSPVNLWTCEHHYRYFLDMCDAEYVGGMNEGTAGCAVCVLCMSHCNFTVSLLPCPDINGNHENHQSTTQDKLTLNMSALRIFSVSPPIHDPFMSQTGHNHTVNLCSTMYCYVRDNG